MCFSKLFRILITRLFVINAFRYFDVAIQGGLGTLPEIRLHNGPLSIVKLFFVVNVASFKWRRTTADIGSHVDVCTPFEIGQMARIFVNFVVDDVFVQTVASRWWTHDINLSFRIDACHGCAVALGSLLEELVSIFEHLDRVVDGLPIGVLVKVIFLSISGRPHRKRLFHDLPSLEIGGRPLFALDCDLVQRSFGGPS